MGLRYLPMTAEDKQAMLKTIGVHSTEDLFSDIPDEIRFKGEYKLQEHLSEYELKKEMIRLANKNISLNEYSLVIKLWSRFL